MTYRHVLLSALLVAMICAAPAPVAAQDWAGAGRIRGVVTDTDGEPVEGARVSYRMLEQPELGPEPFVTDAKGRFSFLGLKGGKWIVKVEAESYYPYTHPEPVDVFTAGVSDTVRVVLEPIPEEELIAKGRYEANQALEAGDAKMQAGDPAGARAEYERARATLQEEDLPIVLGAIGGTYLAEGNLPEAKAAFEQALAINPDHVESLKGMVNIIAFEGDVAGAEELLGRIPEDEPVHPNVLITLGMANFNQGRSDRALELLDRAVRDFPDHALSYYFRGLAQLSLGENDAARADLERSLELDPEHREAANAREFLSQLPAAGESAVAPTGAETE